MFFTQPAIHRDVHSSPAVTPAFFRMADVMRITALSRATLYRRIAEGKFPPPVHLGGRACGWTPAALQAWIDDPEGYVACQATAEAISRAARARLRGTLETGALGDLP